jgi:hypothetical protein
VASGRPGDFGPNAKRIERLLEWVKSTRPGPALNLAQTYNAALRDDIQAIRDQAQEAGEADRRDLSNAGQRAERAAWESADQFNMGGPDREHVVDAVRDAVLAVQVWDLVPQLAERLYAPLAVYNSERDLGSA